MIKKNDFGVIVMSSKLHPHLENVTNTLSYTIQHTSQKSHNKYINKVKISSVVESRDHIMHNNKFRWPKSSGSMSTFKGSEDIFRHFRFSDLLIRCQFLKKKICS